jgi:mono/diheme cytochrome c family protein
MKKLIAALVLLLLVGGPSAMLAASSPTSGPCAPLPAASSAGFEPLLEKFMNSFCYQKQDWQHDAQVRTTDGVHPYVKVWYSPSLYNWLTVSGREGEVPDGAMLVKEQYVSLTAPLHEWTIMVKDSTGSWDGWYWTDLSAPTKPQKPTPPCAEPQISFVGFGLYCMNCHASALGLQGTYATTAHINAPPAAITGNETEIFDNIHQRFPHLADLAPIEQSLAPRNTGIPSAIFANIQQLPLPKSACMPSEALDHVVSGGTATEGPEEFLTSDQCAACHNATGTLSGTNRTDLPSMLWPDSVSPVANLSEYGEWRYSMMGLAGRDPIFFSQLNSESTLHKNIVGQPNAPAFVQNLCLHCHGVMGQRQYQIDNGPNALLTRAELNKTDSKYGALGRDGVSCGVCHHITSDGFGDPTMQATTNTTFTGDFNIGPADEVYGQFADVATYPMQSALGITPMLGEPAPPQVPAIEDARLCGSCHTIILPVYDDNGNQVMVNGQPKTFYEQATFPEWLNSKFVTVPCQTCHMPTEFHGDPLDPDPTLAYKLANIEDNTFPTVPFREPDADITMEIQQPFARHLLLGINTFALEMFKQFRAQLGLYAQDPYLPGKFAPIISSQDTAISESVDEATTQTATVQILSATRSNGTLTADVLVTNLAGHSFPSGVGFRRAFVNFRVLDSSGKELWASGDTSPEGVILGENRKPLVTEFFSPKQQTFQTHYWAGNPITNQNQVQIYEELVTDPQGQLTTSFIALNEKVKDNRLQPQGWSTDGQFAVETGPVGEAANDPDYITTDSSGSNTIQYQVPLTGKVSNAAVVTATLYYQTIPPYYLRQRAEDATGIDTRRLQFYARNLVVKGTPVDGWRLMIANDSMNVQ